MALVRYNRQFLLTDCGIDAPEGWIEVGLPDNWRLFYHRNANLLDRSRDGSLPNIIIGQAYNFDERTATGAGRYALLDWPHISADAAALLGLHYGVKGDRRVVSSCPTLAAQVLEGGPSAPDVTAPLEHRSPINYIPAPGTGFRLVRKLLHDQKLHLPSMRVVHHPSTIAPLVSYGDAVTVLSDELCRFAEELRDRIPGTVYLPLTAGLDSRTIAAAFVATGLRFEATTLEFLGKPKTDIGVARAIARKIGVRHHVVPLQPYDFRIADVLRDQTGGSFLDWENTHVFPGNGYRYLGDGDALIIGGCFEVGRQTSQFHCFADARFSEITGEQVWLKRAGKPGPQEFYGFLDEWIAWRREHPSQMHFCSSFYLDQRLTGWRSAIELAYDLLPGIALNPANNPRIYSALITPDGEDQRAGRLQRDVIARLAPSLVAFPYNPVPLRRIMVGRARTVKRFLFGGSRPTYVLPTTTPAE